MKKYQVMTVISVRTEVEAQNEEESEEKALDQAEEYLKNNKVKLVVADIEEVK